MKGLLRPRYIIIGMLALALLAWPTALSAATARIGSHGSARDAVLQQVEHSRATSASPEALEQEQPEVDEDQDEVEDEAANQEEVEDQEEVENQVPPTQPPTVTSRTFSLIGGTVTFRCTGNVISLGSAVPNAGFSVETEREDGGQEIKVRFESDAHRSEIRAECVGGQVQATELREESH